MFEDDIRILQLLKNRGLAAKQIFDVGASDGIWARAVMPLFEEAAFQLFEPLLDRDMSYALHANQTVALRPGSGVFGMALGAREGFVDFSIVDFQRPDISTSLDLGYSPPAGQVVRIPIHSVDWLVATGAVTEPAIMKIDVQGGEHDVISGARKSLARTQVVMLETWAYRGYGGRTPILLETVNLMASHGFDVFEVGHPQFDEAALLCNLDVWFVNRRCRGQLGLPPI